jgi:uncharacterized protein
MPVSPTYPGVYVQEVPSGVRTIAGVSTATALFVGPADAGPIASPVRCLNYTEFERIFVDPAATAVRDLTRKVKLFYANGGGRCFVVRIAAAALLDLEAALLVVDQEVDLFNLLVLADMRGPALYGPAIAFCQKRRAFLLMDPDPLWVDANLAVAGIAAERVSPRDHGALFFPSVIVREGATDIAVGPSGAIAGLIARIDGNRGVWKAPAGVDADLRGISGLQYRFSDDENGTLNPDAINTLRVFSNGIVNWGARTMDGFDGNPSPSEYKYIPVRRLALYMEESLYRGLKWVVFEPNDEPLWSQIRLNVGTFMHDLFRKGAFQGAKPSDAYFVKCDSETTTQSDRDLGIVNIWVGFAPLKPAEFVVLYLQQMASQAGV